MFKTVLYNLYRLKKIAGILLALMAVFIFSEKANATHLMGSDITYRCISKWKYDITLTVYRDCGGTTLPTSQSLSVGCTNGSWSSSYSLSYIGKKDITGINQSCSTKSKCAGGSFNYGIEEYTFRATIDLSSVSCSEFRISWTQNARNSSISTGAANENFYTEAILKTNLSECNSSPTFTSPAASLICVGTDYIFNNGTLDTIDVGDSISYALVSPLRSKGNAIAYSGSWSAKAPVTFLGFPNTSTTYPGGFRLDSITGDLAFRPTKVNEVSVIVLEVTEWRKISGTMKVVGVTRRDIQVIIINCNGNSPPVITGVSKETCPNESVCIDISTSDANSNDSVKVQWNRGIPAATFSSSGGTIKHDTARICWTPKQSDVSTVPYTFTISAKDNGCPFSAQAVKGFTIFVYEPPAATSQVLSLGCGHVNVDFTPNKVYKDLTQLWTARDTLGNVVSTSTNKADTLHLPKGKVIVTLALKALGNCVTTYVDTLIIPEHVEVHLGADTFACQGVQIPVAATTKDGYPPFHYQWNTLAGDTLTSLTLDTAKGAKYWLTVSDGVGCKWGDTIKVRWDTVPKTAFTTTPLCVNNPITFTNTTFTADLDTIAYTWYLGDTASVSQKSPTKTYTQTDTLTIRLKAQTNYGCKDSTSASLIIKPLPVAAFTVNDTGQCLKQNNFVFTNTTQIAYGNLSHKWYFGDGDTAVTTNTNHRYKKDTVRVVKLITVSNNQCYDSAKAEIAIFTDPVAGFLINNAAQCLLGNSFAFTDKSTVKAGALSYLWNFGDNDTSASKSPQHSYSNHDTLTVQQVVTSVNGCKDTAQKTVIVYPQPVAQYAINDTDQCLNGNSFVFTNQSTIASGNLQYSWDMGDGNGGNPTNFQNVYYAQGTYWAKLTVTSDFNCVDITARQMVVWPRPIPGFIVDDSTQCVNSNTFYYTNTSTVNGGTLSYNWMFGNGKTSTATDTSMVFTIDSIYRVVLRATTEYGCTDTAGQYMVLYSKPTPAYIVNDSTQCVNTDVFNFTNTSAIKAGQGTLAYKWYFGTGDSAATTNPSYGYSVDTSYNVILKVTSSLGCVDSVAHTMTVYPKPTAAFVVNTANQCLNTNGYNFTNKSTIKQGPLTYYWDFDNGKSAVAKDTNIVYAKDSTYTVTLMPRSVFGCYDTAQQTMVVYPVPRVGFAANDSDQCLNTNSYTFNNSSTVKYGTITYEWDLGGEATSTQQKPVFTFSKDTSYTIKLKVTSDKTCTDSLYKTITVFPIPKVAFAINDTDQCVNVDLFSFTNQSKIKYGTLQYMWFVGNGDSIAATSPNYNYPTDGVFTVTQKATSNYNCIDSLRRQVVVFAKPIARYSIDDSSQCVNPGIFKFTNTSSIKYATPLTYNWDFDNGIITTAKDTMVSYPVNGAYYPTLITNTGDNCYDTFTRIVLVYPKPYPDFIIDKDSQCVDGNNFGFTNITTIDSGYLHYVWTYNDGFNDTLANPTHTYAADSSYLVWLKATSDFGCYDSIAKQVIVQPRPQVYFTVDDSGQCVNNNLFGFTNKSAIKYGLLNYQWNFANGDASNSFDTSVVYHYDSNFRVVLRATSDFGCTDTFGRYVVVHSKPTPSYLVNDSDQCFKTQDFKLQHNSQIKTGTFVCDWYFSDGQHLNGDSTPVKFYNHGTYDVKLLLTSNFNCKDSIQGHVIVYDHPNPDFAGLRNYYCTDYPVLSLTPAVAGGVFTGKNMQADLFVPSATGLDTVHYEVYVNGCPSDTVKYTTVHPLPTLYLGADTTLCQHEPIFFNVSFPNSTYLWQPGNITTPIYRAWQPGKYNVTLLNICDTLTDEITITYRDYDCNHFYPTAFTPDGDGLNDVFYPYYENCIEIYMKVYDRWGGVVFETNQLGKGWDGKINTGDFAPIGVYVWHIEAKFDNLGFIYTHAENGTVTLMR
jgi:gliding motility-associated-like protein